MTSGASGAPPPTPGRGLPASDPLAARLFPPLPTEVRWGLGRTERMLAGVGDPHRAYRVLHVGGTNGKGSVARVQAEVLRMSGLRTGLYTSPHLVSFRERILVDGRPPPDRLLEEAARELLPHIEREGPSFFEASTAFAFLVLARSEVEAAVIEVGLGGRLDSTNVVSPEITVVTNVSMEHREMLGSTIEAIAREKAGILKPGVPAFTAADDPAALAAIEAEAEARGTPLQRVLAPGGEVDLEGIRLELGSGRWGRLELKCPLVGRHQLTNVALAVRALEALPPGMPIGADAVVRGVGRTRLAGRFQVEREEGRRWVLDVGHNPAATRSLVRTLAEVAPPRPLVGLVSILRDKEWGTMLDELAHALDALVLTAPGSAPPGRGWDPARVAVRPGLGDAHVVPHFPDAVRTARQLAGPGGTVVATGSFAVVAEALSALGRVPDEAVGDP